MDTGRTDTFTERMLKRASSRTLPRKKGVIEAIKDDNYDRQRVIVQTKRNSTISTLSMEIKNLEQQIKSLDVEKRAERIYPTLSRVREDRSKDSVIEDDREAIRETPKPRRRGCRPNMESTRASLMTSNHDPMTSAETKSSMRIESTISTIPVISDSRDDRIPYEVERFLEDALGDELNNTTVTYGGDQSDGRERTNSHFTASELISEERTPFYRRITRLWNHERRSNYSCNDDTFSMGPRDTSTLDRSLRLYRTLSQRIKKKIRAALARDKSPEIAVPVEPLRQLSFDKDRMDMMEDILKNMKIQQCIIQQASKALNVCRTSKEFTGSSEEVESERLLLLAEIRKHLLQEQLKNLSNTSVEISQAKESVDITECAEVTIENINLSLRECLRREPMPGEPVEWFVVVVIEGTNVWGSSPTPRPVDSMILEFADFVCTIDNLKPNFRIVIRIYSLSLKSGGLYNHEDKYHIANSRMDETVICPSPTKFLKRIEKHTSPRVHQLHTISSSSFGKSGQLQLQLDDLRLSSPWPLTSVPHGSILMGTVDVNLSCRLHLSICHQGFINYGEDAGGFVTWNRRWCVLKGNLMMFWNYPREQECKPPIRTIDLVHSTDERISEVSRELCAKPRTIVVETVRVRQVGDMDSVLVNCRQTYTIERHLLCFDNRKDMNEWKIKLNHVISALREWNVTFMKDAPKSPMVSEL
ncbi:actin-binding protein anillin [Fopius arisanus]|uniref:Actin-binding protein anillin n=1 Tax=Fopius arisanus TaxID=64838 RepID=A0A9R1SWT8_9HYME|nr:PREDICTED: actin-binding protein anillin-like [Fopius arisanus]